MRYYFFGSDVREGMFSFYHSLHVLLQLGAVTNNRGAVLENWHVHLLGL